MGIQVLPSLIVAIFIFYAGHVHSAVITVKNNCFNQQIWPATLPNEGSAPIPTSFELNIPSPWSGRIWARTGCSSESAGKLTCATGDCGLEQCNVAGRSPTSLVEVALGDADGKDTYDISLVDGFNLPVSVTPDNTTCTTTTCPDNINSGCLDELAVRDGNGGIIGCKSACAASNEPQYCCTGDYQPQGACKPTTYSQIFKSKCPMAYSYAQDDPSSTFTCTTGTNYLITFCP